jgi:glycosyltransferase involved in cell wall biosynthesis
MSEFPLVSIIVPVYNAAQYLAATIQAVLDQTWPNKELLIIDDGSTDQSLAVARQFDYPWIKVLKQENSGASVARNLGLSKARGQFVQFLDADDLISPSKVELQVKALLAQPGKIAVCSTVHFNNGENHLGNRPSAYEEQFLFSTDDAVHFLINLWGGYHNKGSMIQTNAWLMPRSVVQQAGPWEEFYSPDDDGEYFSRIILASNGIVYVEGCFNYYRKTQQGLANRTSLKALEGCYQSILLKQKNLFKDSQTNVAKFAIARQLIFLAVESYPKYLEFTKQIISSINELGQYSFTPIEGGPVTRKLSLWFGWKFARLFQYLIHKK